MGDKFTEEFYLPGGDGGGELGEVVGGGGCQQMRWEVGDESVDSVNLP